MEYTRALLAVAVCAAVGVATLSGPLAADTGPGSAGSERLGQGSAEATVGSDGRYDHRVPATTVDIERLDGRPALVYKLRVPALGYARSTTAFPEESGQHRPPSPAGVRQSRTGPSATRGNCWWHCGRAPTSACWSVGTSPSS